MVETLAMLKMRKNFIALDKGRPREPYAEYCFHFLLTRLYEEVDELADALKRISAEGMKLDRRVLSALTSDFQKCKEECADISNMVDYIFERLCLAERNCV